MKEMNRQEVFDTVSRHLIEQGCKSVSIDDMEIGSYSCMYRGEQGTKCAIGALIKDEYYCSTFEGGTLSEELIVEAIEKSLGVTLEYKDIAFLRELQSAHDSSFDEGFREEITDRLKTVARNYELNTKVLEEITNDGV
jgi:hypothetical protein